MDLNEEINYIMKIVKSLEESNLMIKEVCKTIKNEANKQKGGFACILLSTLGASLLGNLLSGKSRIRASEDTIRSSQDF